MSKGGGASTEQPASTPAASTNAVQHLLGMFAPQMFGSGAPPAAGQPAAASDPQSAQYGVGGGMPVMNPQSWMKQGAGNFMPGGTSKGGSGQSSIGDMMSLFKSLGKGGG